MNLSQNIIISDEILTAISEKKPVVALETHGLAHGLPYPQNDELARKMVNKIIQEGALPAFIAMIKGQIRVGLNNEEIHLLTAHSVDVLKANRQDLVPFVLQGNTAGLTVSAGIFIANHCGIRIFSTGGIGGVHYGAEKTFDISNDIYEIANNPITVVCGGPKIILDLDKTMEMMETCGITVCGFQTGSLPVFLSRESHLKVNYEIKNIQDAAKLIHIHQQLNCKSGLIITNPIPREYSIPFEQANHELQKALKKAKEQGISGKDVTIYLLREMNQSMTNDVTQSLEQLILNNSNLSAKIAVSLSQLEA